MQPVPWAQQSYLDASRDVSAQRLVNMYLEPKAAQSKSRTVLRGCPGLRLWATVGDGPCRGLAVLGGFLYVVSGEELYQVDEARQAVLRGNIAGVGPVGLATDGRFLIITTSGSEIYAVNGTEFVDLSATTIISGAAGVTYQDNYLLYVGKNNQDIWSSEPGQPLTYLGESFSLVNSRPDNCTGIVNANRETWAFCETSAEVYYNAGNATGFPFSRNPAGVVERGTLASRSLAAYDQRVFWLGDDYRVYANNGYQAVPISTVPIEVAIGALSTRRSAEAFIYTQEGHTHYVLTFPGQATYVYDITTGLWHERVSYGRSDWRARGHAVWISGDYVGDAENGSIYELATDEYTEAGATIVREMVSPPFHGGRQRLFFGRLELDLQNGVGLEGAEQGSSPQIMLSWSNDGGRTYGTELWRSLGASGRYRWRTVWDRLGSDFDRVYRLRLSDPVRLVAIETYHDVQSGGRR